MTTQPTARIAKIAYRLDAGRTDRGSVPLGLFAQFHVAQDVSVYVLFMRRALKDDERNQMDWIARMALTEPMTYFQAEVDEAVKKGGDVFARLAEKFAWSINVSLALEVPVPSDLVEQLSRAVKELASVASSGRDGGARKASRQRKNTASTFDVEPISAAMTSPTPFTASDHTVANFALAAAPEFQDVDDLSTYFPEPWCIPARFPTSLVQ